MCHQLDVPEFGILPSIASSAYGPNWRDDLPKTAQAMDYHLEPIQAANWVTIIQGLFYANTKRGGLAQVLVRCLLRSLFLGRLEPKLAVAFALVMFAPRGRRENWTSNNLREFIGIALLVRGWQKLVLATGLVGLSTPIYLSTNGGTPGRCPVRRQS